MTYPRRRVERSPEIKEENSSNSTAAKAFAGICGCSVGRDIGKLNVSANEPHASRASNSTNHQQHAAADLFDEEKEPNEGNDGLDDTENAGRQEGGIGTVQTDGLEYRGRIVIDSIDPAAVLKLDSVLIDC